MDRLLISMTVALAMTGLWTGCGAGGEPTVLPAPSPAADLITAGEPDLEVAAEDLAGPAMQRDAGDAPPPPDLAGLPDAGLGSVPDAASEPPDPPPDPPVPPPPAGGHGFPGKYASPSIVRAGSTFHAYFAEQSFGQNHYNTPHARFTADGNWTVVGDALPHLGHMAESPIWAPAAAQVGPLEWVLYYSAKLTGTTSKKCIWRGHSSSPGGPFVDDFGGPIHCAPSSLWAIDPYLVQDEHDHWQLTARIDQPGGINTIQIRQLDAQARNFAPGSSWTVLTHNASSSWEQPVLENAGVVRLHPPSAEPHWFVFYSGRAWDDNSYAIGYADCGPAIDGPCTKKTVDGPWLQTDRTADLFGPGTPTFYTSETGEMLMSIQAWEFSGGKSNARNRGQIMRTYRITVDDNQVPSVSLLRVDK